jgi:predicted RNase H-like HicB family nuclease
MTQLFLLKYFYRTLTFNHSKTMRQVITYKDEDGCWIAECPSLKGCITQGKTKEIALANIKEAISGYIAALEEDSLPIPEETFETFLVVV